MFVSFQHGIKKAFFEIRPGKISSYTQLQWFRFAFSRLRNQTGWGTYKSSNRLLAAHNLSVLPCLPIHAPKKLVSFQKTNARNQNFTSINHHVKSSNFPSQLDTFPQPLRNSRVPVARWPHVLRANLRPWWQKNPLVTDPYFGETQRLCIFHVK